MGISILLGIISAVATIACAVLGAKLHRKTERIKIMEGQLSEKRFSAYAKLYDFFYELFKSTKSGKRINDKDTRNALLDAKKELIMYGTDDVIHALNKYLSSLTEDSFYVQIGYFLDIMVLIRKDMCGNSEVTKDDILLNIMQDKKEMQKFKEMAKSDSSNQ